MYTTTETAYSACQDKSSFMQTAAENDLASELHWRIAALEALHAFVVGPCSQASSSHSSTLTSASAALLQPTLDAICPSPALQVLPMQLPIAACNRQDQSGSAVTASIGVFGQHMKPRVVAVVIAHRMHVDTKNEYKRPVRLCKGPLQKGAPGCATKCLPNSGVLHRRYS